MWGVMWRWSEIVILKAASDKIWKEGRAGQGMGRAPRATPRYFLDQVCDDILEIDGLGDTFPHPGDWGTFLRRRAERFEVRANRKQDAIVQLRRAEQWMMRGPQGRGTKAKAKIRNVLDNRERAAAVVAADDGAPNLESRWLTGSKMATGTNNFGKIGLRNVTVLRDDGTPILDQVMCV